jgi:KamA family protein
MNRIATAHRPIAEDLEQGFVARRFQVYTQRDLQRIKNLEQLPEELRFEMDVVARALPFRVNEYVVNELIDWERAPEDPIFQLTFPQKGMLEPGHYEHLEGLVRRGAAQEEIDRTVFEIRSELNPHPAGQMELNAPLGEDGQPLNGLQHKYRETVLFFPSQGQTCHAYCTFCFRWAQFVGDKELRIASTEAVTLHRYLREHREVTDLLVTGGDPMVMKTRRLREYLEPLLQPEFEHIKTIRIGTKALTFWPYRFVTDEDADDLLFLLEQLVEGGKHVAIMAHYNHWQELQTDISVAAIRRLRDTGAVIRSQGPLLARINDDANVWKRLWNDQINLGVVPYYMFVERDTGAKRYFEVPLAQAWDIYRDAVCNVSGLGRTVRGPSMSASPGKVEVQGVTEINGEKLFVLRFIQGRDSEWVQRPFFARYDERATWLDQLQPALGEERFFFEEGYQAICEQRSVTP